MAFNWVIIFLLIVIAFVFLRVRHFKNKIYAVAIIILIIFFYVTGNKLVQTHNLNLKSIEGLTKAGKIYFNWFVSMGKNIRTTIGNAINMNWASNSTAIK